MVDRYFLLNQLPPLQNKWIKIKDKQDAGDIISQILGDHEKFAPYYDNIALYFDAPDTATICKNLYTFCKRNFKYVEESKEFQSTSVPNGLLYDGYCDCKGYASFCGGILDGINRLTGKDIDWCYRFASYKLNPTPHHVFVVVTVNGREKWIDATPEGNNATPLWEYDSYKIASKTPNMGLYSRIAGRTDFDQAAIGVIVAPVVDVDQLNFDGKGKYKDAFGHYLGLSAYADYEGSLGTNWADLTAAINQLIAQGPNPGFTVPQDFVKWIFDNSIRSWNFFYPGGVEPGFNADALLPEGYPRPVLTDDGRLTFDHDAQLDDYRNADIHLITAWLQAIINQEDATPYPLKPRDVKLFSQAYTGNPNNTNANFFREWRGKGFFQEVGKALEHAVNFVKQGVLLVIGSIPRNAFLALVGLNIFHMADDLARHIDAGDWDRIAKKWKSLGGNPDKLLNTIRHGAGKDAVSGTIGITGADDTAAFLAAATPIILALMQFLNKDGKLDGVIRAGKAVLQQQFPGQDFTFLDGALVNGQTGQPYEWQVNPADDENQGGGNNDLPGSSNILAWMKKNNILVSLGAGLASYFFINPKGRKKNYWLPGLISAASFFLLGGMGNILKGSKAKRTELKVWAANSGESQETIHTVTEIFDQLTDDEVNTVYDFIFHYVVKGTKPAPDSELYTKMEAINSKYNLFT